MVDGQAPYKGLGEAMAHHRAHRGSSLRNFASAVGVDHGRLSRIESGLELPELWIVDAYERLLALPFGTLRTIAEATDPEHFRRGPQEDFVRQLLEITAYIGPEGRLAKLDYRVRIFVKSDLLDGLPIIALNALSAGIVVHWATGGTPTKVSFSTTPELRNLFMAFQPPLARGDIHECEVSFTGDETVDAVEAISQLTAPIDEFRIRLYVTPPHEHLVFERYVARSATDTNPEIADIAVNRLGYGEAAFKALAPNRVYGVHWRSAYNEVT